MFPDFDQNGDLPVGIYEAVLQEVVEHFGVQNFRRRGIAHRLVRIYDLAVGTGRLKRFIIFGSFVTDKIAPNDIDIFLLMNDSFDPTAVMGEASVNFQSFSGSRVRGSKYFLVEKFCSHWRRAICGGRLAIQTRRY